MMTVATVINLWVSPKSILPKDHSETIFSDINSTIGVDIKTFSKLHLSAISIVVDIRDFLRGAPSFTPKYYHPLFHDVLYCKTIGDRNAVLLRFVSMTMNLSRLRFETEIKF